MFSNDTIPTSYDFTIRTVGKYISSCFAGIETETQKEKMICIISQEELATPPHDV